MSKTNLSYPNTNIDLVSLFSHDDATNHAVPQILDVSFPPYPILMKIPTYLPLKYFSNSCTSLRECWNHPNPFVRWMILITSLAPSGFPILKIDPPILHIAARAFFFKTQMTITVLLTAYQWSHIAFRIKANNSLTWSTKSCMV